MRGVFLVWLSVGLLGLAAGDSKHPENPPGPAPPLPPPSPRGMPGLAKIPDSPSPVPPGTFPHPAAKAPDQLAPAAPTRERSQMSPPDAKEALPIQRPGASPERKRTPR